ncbi:hypothetical protein T4C_5380 [Trichinella pseudospiralis]|uniref:Uncharacterized protein n=1 Tax=Trichinella pseudospiralis TaxID=6337 RepID=A0A0V1JVF5_TRIPS|nr:hypothetical protein T4C_5380 [Trichinella pseudospiralis]
MLHFASQIKWLIIYKVFFVDPIRIRSAIIPRYLLDHTGNLLRLHHQCLIKNITKQKQRYSSLDWIQIYASLH